MTNSNEIYRLLDELLALDAQAAPERAAYLLRDFVQAFSKLEESDQKELRALLTPGEARKVMSLSLNAAEQALVEADPQWLDWAILAHEVEQFQWDPRDNIRLLSAIDLSASRLGIDPTELFRRMAPTVSDRAAKYLREFAARPANLRDTTAMGGELVLSTARPRFVF